MFACSPNPFNLFLFPISSEHQAEVKGVQGCREVRALRQYREVMDVTCEAYYDFELEALAMMSRD